MSLIINNNHHQLNLPASSRKQKTCTPPKLPKLSQKDKDRISKEAKEALANIPQILNTASSLAKGKLFKFIKSNCKNLSYFAIKRPSDWLLFSQDLLYKFDTECQYMFTSLLRREVKYSLRISLLQI